MLVNSCYISQGMTAWKVSNSKSNLQGHSRALAIVPFNRPYTISYQTSIAFMSLSCTVSKILSLISKNWKRSRDPNTSLSVVIYHWCPIHLCINQHTTFDRRTDTQTTLRELSRPHLRNVCIHRGPKISVRIRIVLLTTTVQRTYRIGRTAPSVEWRR